MFSFNLLHSSVLRICFMISAAHFSDELGMQTDLTYIFISAAWSSDRSFSGAVTKQGDGFLICWCITYNYMIIAARFSYSTGILHRYSYYEVAAEVTFCIVNFQWLSFGSERDTFPDSGRFRKNTLQ